MNINEDNKPFLDEYSKLNKFIFKKFVLKNII